MAQPIWNTTAGSIGSFASLEAVALQLSASPVLPATTLTYVLLSGDLPSGLSLSSSGLISGIPTLVQGNITSTFVVRVTDNLGQLKDRTFTMTISGDVSPSFTTPAGVIAEISDSTWFQQQITYNNPVSTNPVTIRVVQGALPSGIEINEYGMLRGYAAAPTISVNLAAVNTTATAISSNQITCFSTIGFAVGTPVTFSGTTFGGIVSSLVYYVQSIIDERTFTISLTASGPQYTLNNGTGSMDVNLAAISVGQPTIQTFSFTLKLESLLGNSVQLYSITVINQNTPVSSGGPGRPANTRVPTIFNTRPETFNIASNEQDYGYYVLPPNSRGETYTPQSFAYIGQISNDNFFSFRILGYDFDGNSITYSFSGLPAWLTGNTSTGWITGIPNVSDNSINEVNFSATVNKTNNPGIGTPAINFSLRVSNNIVGAVRWLTSEDLGILYNGTVSVSKVLAVSDVELEYRLAQNSNPLPPNLVLLSNGEISGVVAYQPTDVLLEQGASTDFSFTIEAFSPKFPVVNSTKTFTLSVYQLFTQPTDTLYIKCVPSVTDRELIASLLDNTSLIPTEFLYRPNDPYFGKASSVIYEHAFGIYASTFDQYVAAITKNHYWRNITLGAIKTAIARDDAGNVIYEVVYSEVIDNLVNPQGESVSPDIYWPRPIPLNLGPWYTSETDLFTSYVNTPSSQQFYTSLTPGFARLLYPNSLQNMRDRVGEGIPPGSPLSLGQEFNFRLLPRWMTSQQYDGSTLGYTAAWVIAYCKPSSVTVDGSELSFAQYIQYQIQNNWKDPVGYVNTLNTINFRIDRFTVDKSITYNYDNTLVPPSWTDLPSATPPPNPLDSRNFNVLFPQETILPNKTQY